MAETKTRQQHLYCVCVGTIECVVHVFCFRLISLGMHIMLPCRFQIVREGRINKVYFICIGTNFRCQSRDEAATQCTVARNSNFRDPRNIMPWQVARRQQPQESSSALCGFGRWQCGLTTKFAWGCWGSEGKKEK